MTSGAQDVPHPARILIYTASMDGGDHSTAAAMEAYFREHCAETVYVRTVDFMARHAPNLDVLGRFAFDSAVEFLPTARGTFMDLTTRMPQNPVVHELMATGFANAEAYVKAFKPDAVISTHPVPGGVVTEFKRSLSLLAATVVTDYGARRLWLHPGTDLYFVATKELRDDIVVRGIPYDRVVVSGNPIDESFAAPGTSETARASLGLADRFTVLLAPTGGPADGMRSLARALAGAGIQVVAVAGRDERSQQALQRLGEKHPLLHAFGPATETSALMRAADLVVGGSGGPTCSQAFALGAPVIVYDPGPGQETHDAGFVVMWGAGLEAGTEEGVVEIVRFLSTHPERLSQLASNAAELGRPSAARAVCERVLAGLR